MLVCSQLTEPGALAGGGKLPSLTILLTFTLQSQLFKAACTSAPCQPASPSCEKWVMEFKGTHSLVALHSSAMASLGFLFLVTHGSSSNSSNVCVCNSVSCSEILKAVWECVSVNQKTFIITFSAGIKAVAHSPNVSLSVCLLRKLAYILPHDLPLEIKIYER